MQQSLILSLVVAVSLAAFENTHVQNLSTASFQDVLQGNEFWLVLFHNGNLGALEKTYQDTARALGNMVNVASVQDPEYASPQVKVFSTNKEEPVLFEEEFTAQKLVEFAFEHVRNYAFLRVGNKVPKKKTAEVEEELQEDDVIVLDDDNIEESILNSEDAWFVEFYAPWCDHCKKLAPHWAKLATELKGQVKVAKIDASKNNKANEKYKVKGYPSIKFFGAGEKLDGDWEDYDGARELAAMTSYALEAKRRLRPLYFEQLLSQQQFQSECLDFQGVCVILFVPHLYDCGKECRENYLKVFKDTVLPHKQKPFVYFWSQGADQYDFEEQFSLGGAGYPSVLAISPKKSVWSKMRGSFNSQNVDKFIQNLVRGREQFAKYRSLIAINKVKAWDGQDFKK